MVFSVHNHGFYGVPNTFCQEKHQHFHADRQLVTKKEISIKINKCAAFFDQIFPWSFWSIDQLDRLFHICLEFCHVVPVVLRCVVLRLAVCCVVRLCCTALRCVVLQSAVCCVDRLCCVVLCCMCCCHALYLFCFDVVFSSLSLLRLALCCSCLVFGMVLLAFFAFLLAVLSCVGSLVLRCVALRCVALCSVGIFCRRCVALQCVAFCFVMLCVVVLCSGVALRLVVYCLLCCGVVLCCVVDKSCLVTLVMF